MNLVRDPADDALVAFLREEISRLHSQRHRIVCVVGECTVDYQGRAKSALDGGDRLVVMKSDGTFLVHGHDGVQPINWMPPGGTFQVAVEDDDVVLTSHRADPLEVVRVTFHSCEVASATELRDDQELELYGIEADLSDLLAKHPETIDDGFVPFDREKESRRGVYDLYGVDGEGRRVVVEVKRTPAGLDAAQQLWRYVDKERDHRDGEVRGILVAPKVSDRASKLLDDKGLESRTVDWDELMPRIERMRRSGQATLGRFEEE